MKQDHDILIYPTADGVSTRKIEARGRGYKIILEPGKAPVIEIDHAKTGVRNVKRDGEKETFEIGG